MTCDYCDEEIVGEVHYDGNPYGRNMQYCTPCMERSADKEPDYDKETADESYNKAWREHQELHS